MKYKVFFGFLLSVVIAFPFSVNALDPAVPENSPQRVTGSDAPDAAESISDRIRRAGELALDGDTVRASEIVKQAIRDCDSNTIDTRDCSAWFNSLRGLNDILRDPRKKTVYTNSVGMNLVRLPATDYMMGSLKQEMDWLRLTFRKTWRDGHKQWFQD